MRLKAAYTVEASVIVPLFTVIVAVMIQMMLFLHDRAIYGAVEVKKSMQEEFCGRSYQRETEEYLKERLVLKADRHEIGNVEIRENNMPRFARISKVLAGGKE